ncbi:hypothetical protein EV424DRAFT_1537254 [Suillus variegatus]|nr:hypothetical protein EV424DRAFT_1537254 [Suillus variegatus]
MLWLTILPPNVLADEGDILTEIASTPSTPFLTPRITIPPILVPEPTTTPVTTPKPSLSHTIDMEDEMLPIPPSHSPPHPPSDADNKVMSDHSPPSTSLTSVPLKTTTSAPSTEEDLLHAHLAIAETNRSIIRLNSINSLMVITQFTPVPQGSFPHIHLAHTAQLFDFQAAKVITAWLKVLHPKILIRVFNHDGKNPSVKGPILIECLCRAITKIAYFIHQDEQKVKVSPLCPEANSVETDQPLSFLIYNISEEMKTLILNQCIWSSTDIFFMVHQFSINSPPLLLFCLHGFSTTDTNTVNSAIHDTWTEDMTKWDIRDILSECEIPEEKVHIVAWDFINSLWVECLDFKANGGISLPCYIIFAVSPTSNPTVWTKLQAYLHSLIYPLELEGSGTAVNFIPCPLCHSITHPHGLCPFPNVPLWNGPKHNVNPRPSNMNMRGRGKVSYPAFRTRTYHIHHFWISGSGRLLSMSESDPRLTSVPNPFVRSYSS